MVLPVHRHFGSFAYPDVIGSSGVRPRLRGLHIGPVKKILVDAEWVSPNLNPTIGSVPGGLFKKHSCRRHCIVIGGEVITVQEKLNLATGLLADGASLRVCCDDDFGRAVDLRSNHQLSLVCVYPVTFKHQKS